MEKEDGDLKYFKNHYRAEIAKALKEKNEEIVVLDGKIAQQKEKIVQQDEKIVQQGNEIENLLAEIERLKNRNN
jgi:Holliday junction resolvase